MKWIARSSLVPLLRVTRETRIWPGLLLLRDALERAGELRQDAWDFAVEIRKLRAAGLTHSDLRWLVCKGYAEHAVEARSTDVSRRSFLRLANLALPQGTCFVLTPRGLLLVGRGRTGGRTGSSPEHLF